MSRKPKPNADTSSEAAENFWTKPLADLQADLGSGLEGLAGDEAAVRLEHHGRNVLMARRKRPLFLEFLAHFLNPLVLLLITASAVSALTGETTSFVIISVMVLSSVTLDFVQEHRASQSAERLRQSVALSADVTRDGLLRHLPAAELVPGDVVHLSAGDMVPADGRVIAARDFFVNQSLLTGESYPVENRNGTWPARRWDWKVRPTPSSWARRWSAERRGPWYAAREPVQRWGRSGARWRPRPRPPPSRWERGSSGCSSCGSRCCWCCSCCS
jgi:magnesium-transporting ATPase (P-type)